jgi:hypothetical protein
MHPAIRIALLVLSGLGLLAVIAAPIIGVILFQNHRRRKWYRRFGEKHGFKVDLDPTARFIRATPSAGGKRDGFEVAVGAGKTSERYLTVSTGTRFRLDMENSVVGGPAHPFGQVTITCPWLAPSSKHGFDAVFNVEGDGNGRLGELFCEDLKKRFLEARERIGSFSIKLEPGGALTSTHEPPFNRRKGEKIEGVVDLMLAIAGRLREVREEEAAS